MFPSPEHKTLKLVGTVIISPPAKTLLSNKEIKQEDDWLKLPKNVPTDTRSLMDPSVKFTIKHADGSVCRLKKTWAFYTRKPPQKDDEVPALGVKKSSKYSLCSGKASSDKDKAIIEIKSCLDDTKELENQTDTEEPNSTHKESKNKHEVNTENAVTTDGADSQNVPVNTENIDETLDETSETGVTTENSIMNSQGPQLILRILRILTKHWIQTTMNLLILRTITLLTILLILKYNQLIPRNKLILRMVTKQTGKSS